MSPEHPGPVSRLGKALGLLVALLTARRAAQTRTPPPEGGGTEPEFDPRRRVVPANRRAETAVAALLGLAAVFGLGFTVVYVVLDANTQLLGIAIGGALCLLAAAAIVAGKLVVPQETAVEERGRLLEEPETEAVVEMIEAGGEGISRRVLLIGAGGVAGAALVTAAATPLASLGPTLSQLHDTPWARGTRLVDDQGRPYLAGEIEIGSFYTALPEHADPEAFGAGLLVVRLPANFLHLPAARHGWAPSGIVAYSKICPHAGCAISLYRYPTYAPTSQQPAFTCPCHYSTFLPGEGGRVMFGPAGALAAAAAADDRLRAATCAPPGRFTRTSARPGGACTGRSREPRSSATSIAGSSGPHRAGDQRLGVTGGDQLGAALRVPRPLVVPARRDRALLVHRARRDRDLPDALLHSERFAGHLPRLLPAALRASRCRRPTGRCSTSRPPCRPGCCSARSTTGPPTCSSPRSCST